MEALTGLLGGAAGGVGGLDIGSILGGLTGTSTSACAADDDACKKQEDEKAAKAALEKKQKEDGTYRQEEFTPPVSSTGLECSMDGCVDMTKKFMENLLLLLSLAKESFAYLLPEELNLSVQLLWDGTMGLSSWIGFAAAALYYVGTDYGFGMETCEALGYGFYVIDGMNYIVAFAKPAEEPKKEATPEQKAAAAAAAKAAAEKSKADQAAPACTEGNKVCTDSAAGQCQADGTTVCTPAAAPAAPACTEGNKVCTDSAAGQCQADGTTVCTAEAEAKTF